jgi:hypothetical protein
VAFWQHLSDAHRDGIVAEAERSGVPLLPILIVRADGVAHEPREGPALDEWLAYVSNVVRRYPGIHSWEIWNEPNARRFGGTISVRRWREFVSLTALVIHAARPDARVVAGGITVTVPGWRRYLRVQDVDAVAIHPYTANAAQALRLVREARRISRKPVWVTELDWIRGDAAYAARELRRFIAGFHGPTFWYHLRDDRRVPASFGRDGLFTEHWKPKPAWKELLKGRTPR